MADFEKVYRIGFKTGKAELQLDKLDSKIAVIEKRIAGLFKSPQISSAIKSFNKHLRTASTNVSKIGKSAKKTQKDISDSLRKASKSANSASRNFLSAGKSGKTAGDKIALGARRAERGLRRVGVASKSVSFGIGALAAKVGLLIGAAQGIRSIGGEFLAFDQSMTLAGAKLSKLEPQITPGTEAFKEYSKGIRQATADTEHANSAVAGAVDFWAKAGKSSEQIKAVIPATADFASANTDAAGSMLNMAQAGDILSDTLGQFQLDSADPTELLKNTARVSDVMSAAANQANFSATEMFESFKQAGPVLTAVGGDIEETAALLATMANAGLKGSFAGRSLKIATAAINAPTARQIKLYKKYNIITQDAEGNMLKLTDIIGQLDFATKGLGKGERFGVFAQLFGRQGVTGFLNLLAKGHGELGKMTESLRAASGETKRLAEITRTSATAQMQMFWKKITGLGFTVIEQTDLFGKLGRAVDRVDWVKAADFVINDLVPAINTVGRIIRNVLYPALVLTTEHVKTLFAPALFLIEKLFGSAGDSGEGLAKVLSYLGTLWVAHRGYLLAVKAIGMIQWFTDLIAKIVAAGNAQAALNTKTVSTNSSLAGSVKQFGLLNSAMGVFAAGVAGWTIGTIIHDQLVEPLAKAADTLAKLKMEIADTEAKGLEGRTVGLLESDKATAEKAIKLEKEQQSTLDIFQSLTGMGGMGAMGVGIGIGPGRTKGVEESEDFKSRVEEQLIIKRAEENVRRFDNEQGAPQSIARSVFDMPDQFGHGASLDTGEAEILPERGTQTFDPNLAADIGRMEEKLDALSAQKIPENLEGGFSQFSPLSDVSMEQLVSGQANQMKIEEKMAADTRAFQASMMAENSKSKKPTSINNTVTTGPISVTVPVQSGDPLKIARAVKKEIKTVFMDIENDMANEARATGPAEI